MMPHRRWQEFTRTRSSFMRRESWHGSTFGSATFPAPNTGKSERLRCVTWRMRSCGATTPVFFVCTRCFGELRPAISTTPTCSPWVETVLRLFMASRPTNRPRESSPPPKRVATSTDSPRSPRRSYLPIPPISFSIRSCARREAIKTAASGIGLRDDSCWRSFSGATRSPRRNTSFNSHAGS